MVCPSRALKNCERKFFIVPGDSCRTWLKRPQMLLMAERHLLCVELAHSPGKFPRDVLTGEYSLEGIGLQAPGPHPGHQGPEMALEEIHGDIRDFPQARR